MTSVDSRPDAGALRLLDVGDGHVVVVRRAVVGDADALFDLFEQLDDDDRRRRSGTARMPRPAWFEQLARGDGGIRMVAELRGASTRRLVGEAGYARLPSGNGELTMVVAPRWRGVTGPLLLDELLAAAAREGVANVDADVALDNGPMLSILHERGPAVVRHDHWRAVRLRVGTSGTVPTWDGAGTGARVLVEAPAGRCASEDDLQSAGVAMLTCHGPRRRRGCAAIDGSPCPLAAGADVVVVVEPPVDGPWQRLANAHPTLHPGAALVRVPFAEASRSPGTIPRLVSAALAERSAAAARRPARGSGR